MPPKKDLTVAQLKAKAKASGLTGYSKLDKAGLIALLATKSTKPKAGKAGKATTKPKAGKAGKATTKPKGGKAGKAGKATTKSSSAPAKWQYNSTQIAEAVCSNKPDPNGWVPISAHLASHIEKQYQAGVEKAKVKDFKVVFGDSPTISGKMKLPDGNYTFTCDLARV